MELMSLYEICVKNEDVREFLKNEGYLSLLFNEKLDAILILFNYRKKMVNNEDFKKILLKPKPNAILGKKGIINNEGFINHISKLLKKYKIIKIKALRSVATKSNIVELANSISEATNAYLLDVRGRTFIISKFPIKTK